MEKIKIADNKILEVYAKEPYNEIGKEAEVVADLVKDFSEDILLDTDKWFHMAFCIEVLEHVKFPEVLLSNINRSLIDGGILVFSVPFFYKEHSSEDYWRFTESGIKLMLDRNGFELIEIKQTTNDLMGWVGSARKKDV